MRIRVVDILEMLADGVSKEEILDDFPDLDAEDIQACLLFAAERADIPQLVALKSGLTPSFRRHWHPGSKQPLGVAVPRFAILDCATRKTGPFSTRDVRAAMSLS